MKTIHIFHVCGSERLFLIWAPLIAICTSILEDCGHFDVSCNTRRILIPSKSLSSWELLTYNFIYLDIFSRSAPLHGQFVLYTHIRRWVKKNVESEKILPGICQHIVNRQYDKLTVLQEDPLFGNRKKRTRKWEIFSSANHISLKSTIYHSFLVQGFLINKWTSSPTVINICS